MARIISSEMVECGDGVRSVTTYDSNWCKHKTDKDYCPKCNIIIDKTITLTHKQLYKLFKIPKGFKITSLGDYAAILMPSDLKIHIRFKERRRK